MRIAAAISAQLKIDVPIIVKLATELTIIITENSINVDTEEHPRLLVAIAQDVKGLSSLAAFESLVVLPDQFARGKHAVYVLCAAGDCNARGALLGKAGRSGITRNWATVLKLHALANEVTRESRRGVAGSLRRR